MIPYDFSIDDNHRMSAVWHRQSPNHGGTLVNPRVLVLHYTAGWSAAGARDYLMNPDAPYTPSAHLVAGRDGRLWQIVPFDLKAWHAGRSFYKGITGLNHHSIGIEIDNIGWLRPYGTSRNGQPIYVDPYGTRVEVSGGNVIQPGPGRHIYCDEDDLLLSTHPNAGPATYAWPAYTAEQLYVVERAVRSILARYPTIRWIVGHDEITSRKTDPGPAFPMARFRALVSDRRAAEGERAVVTASALNVREGAGIGYDRLDWGPLPRGAEVEVLDEVGEWAFVAVPEDDSRRGYVHQAYLTPA